LHANLSSTLMLLLRSRPKRKRHERRPMPMPDSTFFCQFGSAFGGLVRDYVYCSARSSTPFPFGETVRLMGAEARQNRSCTEVLMADVIISVIIS
jgi:hypothetical protein